MYRSFSFATAAFAVLSLVLFFAACKPKTPVEVNPEFANYIAQFSSGTISARGDIAIRFRDDIAMKDNTGDRPSKEVFSFEPSIKGHSYWADERTLIFKPDNPLPAGKELIVTVKIGEVAEVPKEFSVFQFPLMVAEQHIHAEVASLETIGPDVTDYYRLIVTVNSSDVAVQEDAAKIVQASLDGRSLKITMNTSGLGQVHTFSIDSIARADKRGKLLISWDGKPIGAPEKGEREVIIPSFADFSVLGCRWVQDEEQYVEITFSDPLKAKQNLRGLVTLGGTDLSLVIENNRIKAHPSPVPTEDATLTVHKGVTTVKGHKLEEPFTYVINFRPLTPDIRWVHGTGNILPSGTGTVFPFEAVSLRAVDVKIIRVFENNVPQFLQVNRLDGQREIKRVGRVVAQRIVRLDQQPGTNLRQWNRYYLDLDKYVKTEPGAIYRIEVSFNKRYAITDCGDPVVELPTEQPEPELWTYSGSEYSYWDYYDDDYYDYDWYYYGDNQDPNDPCTDRYYQRKRGLQTNVISSDLGLLFKKGQLNEALACVTDLRSAGSVSDCQVEILDYQLQTIASGKTDGKGNIQLKFKEREVPFLMVASKGKQKGYLRLDMGSALSTSRFDVSGSAVQSAMKGFIYGERGVWRPGDTLFVSFMLEDRNKNLPVGHPLVLEFFNPRGQQVDRQVQNLNDKGFHSFILKTDEDAPTGLYTVNVKAGGAFFAKSLRVETVKPNRLKVELDFGSSEIKAGQSDMKATLKTRWLHGATAANMKTEVTAVFRAAKTYFEKYKDYSFDDPSRGFYSYERIVHEGITDSKGETKFSVESDLRGQAPGKVTAVFNTRVFEGGGDFSVDQMSIGLSPYEDYVGVKVPKGDEMRGMLLTDTDHTCSAVLLTEDGKPQANRELTWELYKVSWRWWWEQGEDNLSRYNGSEGLETIDSGTMKTNAKGEASFKIRVNYPQWGRYLVRVIDPTNDHSTGQTVYIDWPGWAGRSSKENPGGATMLVFAADKEVYAPGDKVKLTIPSSAGGRALISIENGSGILQHLWVNTTDKQTVFEFTATEGMTPNVFASVTLIQPHAQTANDLPIRLYGIIPIRVEDKGSRLAPVIQLPETLAPDEAFTVKVSEQSGRGMSYTVAIVDEGLLDLTRFKTPDPWARFYAREAHGVTTWDLYDQVIGAFGGTIERLLSIGGDGELDGGGKKKAQRFKPVVFFSGPHELKKGQTASHTFTMPNYVGSVRAMVVAREGRAYGHTEKAVPVKKPLMALATLPRTLSPGDKVKLPVTVFAMESKVKDVEVTVKATGPVKMLSDKQNISFSQPGDKAVEFEFEVLEKAGVATFEVRCTSGSEKASHKIEVQVRNPNPAETDFYSSLISAGEEWMQLFDTRGIEGTNEAAVEISAFALTNQEKHLRYLIGYPHGCLEQTISKSFPQLYLADVMDLNETTKAQTRKYVQEGIDKIAKMQRTDGGVTYWPGSGGVHDWTASYALHFLTEAKAKGHSVPASMYDRLIDYQQNSARRFTGGRTDEKGNASYGFYEQSYRLYTLAHAGKADLSSMNRMKQEKNLPVTTQWMLAAAYAKAGQPKTGRDLVMNAQTSVADYRETAYHFGSAMRDLCIIYMCMIDLNEKDKASEAAKKILDRMNSDAWLSTNEAAYGLMAVSRIMKGETGKQVKFEAELNGKKLSPNGTSRPMIRIPLSELKKPGNSLKIKNTSGNPIFARLAVSGQPLIGNETDKSSGVNMIVTYADRSGRPVDLGRIEQGTDIIATVNLSYTGVERFIPNMALTQIFPSGFEIRNPRMDAGADSYQQDAHDYQDIRDDRSMIYFTLDKNKPKKFVVVLHAAYRGTYYLPATNCENMYDPTVFARKAGRQVKIVSTGGETASAK